MDAWNLGQQNISKAQSKQKQNYYKSSSDPALQFGDRVMVRMPSEVKGESWKFARPYHGPFGVISVTPTNAEVMLVDQPGADIIFVSLKRVCSCYQEMPDISWSGHLGTSKRKKNTNKHKDNDKLSKEPRAPPYSGPSTRSMTRSLK